MSKRGEAVCVLEALLAIGTASRSELIEQWLAKYKRSPPKGISRRLLEYSAAYQIQAKAYGKLKPKIRRRLSAAGNGNKAVIKRKYAALQPGTRLMREWHGRTYTVDVTDHGFICDGKHHSSLSQIAIAITGARWSGPRFFGL